MHKISVNRVCKFLVLVVLLLTPLFNIFEVSSLLNRKITSQQSVLTPIYIKLIKDVFLLMIICLGILRIISRQRILAEKSFWIFVFGILLSLGLSIFNQDFLLTVAGFRYVLPFFVLLSVYGIIDDEFQGQLAILLIVLFVIGLIMQTYELFCPGWYGSTFWGLSKRNPGFYLIPSSMAMFSLITMYYGYHYYHNGILRSILIYVLGPLSVLLTASGTGIICLGLFMATIGYFKIKPKSLSILAFSLLILLIFLFLPKIINRGDIYTSLFMRFQKLSDGLRQDSLLLSTHFGYGTNTACLLASNLGKGAAKIFVTDSTFISMIVSFGLLPMMFFVLFLARSVGSRIIHIHFIVIFVSFMFTVIIFELFPANLLFSINLAYFLKTKHNQKCANEIICAN